MRRFLAAAVGCGVVISGCAIGSAIVLAGIVARVARTLAEQGVNITALQTQSRPGPETGTPMFTMRIRMAVPAEVDRGALRERLERVAADLRVDVSLAELRE